MQWGASFFCLWFGYHYIVEAARHKMLDIISPGAVLFYLIKPLAVKPIKTLPRTPPHVSRPVLIHALYTAVQPLSRRKHSESGCVRQGNRRIKPRSTSSRCDPDNTRLLYVYAPKFDSAQSVFGRVFRQCFPIIFANTVFHGKPHIPSFILRDAAGVVLAQIFFFYDIDHCFSIITKDSIFRRSKPDVSFFVFHDAGHVYRWKLLK